MDHNRYNTCPGRFGQRSSLKRVLESSGGFNTQLLECSERSDESVERTQQSPLPADSWPRMRKRPLLDEGGRDRTVSESHAAGRMNVWEISSALALPPPPGLHNPAPPVAPPAAETSAALLVMPTDAPPAVPAAVPPSSPIARAPTLEMLQQAGSGGGGQPEPWYNEDAYDDEFPPPAGLAPPVPAAPDTPSQMIDIFDSLRMESDDEDYELDDVECERALTHLSDLAAHYMSSVGPPASDNLGGVAEAMPEPNVNISACELLAVLDAQEQRTASLPHGHPGAGGLLQPPPLPLPQSLAAQPQPPQQPPSQQLHLQPQPLLASPTSHAQETTTPTALAIPMAAGGIGEVRRLSATSRNALERKEWTPYEDEVIRVGVQQYGRQWRRIAANLSGRSDDAVRNRWNRLKERPDRPESCPFPTGEGYELDGRRRWLDADARFDSDAAEAAAIRERRRPSAEMLSSAVPPGCRRAASEGSSLSSAPSRGEGRPERVSWTHAEDAVIFASVAEFGHKWYRIEQRLPGRTGHAIRNRWQRLLNMVDEGGGPPPALAAYSGEWANHPGPLGGPFAA